MLRGAERADLPSGKGASSRAAGPKSPRNLAGGVQAGDAGAPVDIHVNAAVEVLGAYRDLQRL